MRALQPSTFRDLKSGEQSHLWVISRTFVACKRASEDFHVFHSHLGHQLRRACTLGPK